MSTGHHHERYGDTLLDIPPAECNRIMADPRISARLKQKPTIDDTYDVPYLAGYSKNGKTVYIDRHFPFRKLKIGKDTVNVLPFLLIHETVEKAIIDVLKKPYKYAHTVATFFEEKAARAAGINIPAYEKAYEPYIKRDELEKIKRPPPDLDMTPYIDSRDTKVIQRLRAVMARNQHRTNQ